MREYAAVGDWVTYIPEFDGNREAFENGDDSEPITVEIKPMTVREVSRRSGDVRAKPGQNGIRTNAAEIRLDTFCKNVRNIRNLRIGGKDITTAEELLDTGLPGLVNEIEAAISNVSVLDEGDRKNCESRSAGKRTAGNGTASAAPTPSE